MFWTKYIIRLFVFLGVIVLGILIWHFLKKDLFETPQEKTQTVHHLVLTQIESMGKLELVKYKFKDVLEHTIVKEWLPDSKALLIIAGEAVGCIDLKKIKAEDIIEQDSLLTIHLPEAELCYYKINHDESKVYQTSNTYFDEAAIIDQAYKVAEAQLKKTALESNILVETRLNAEKILKPLLERVAHKKIQFVDDLTNKELKYK